MWKFFFLFSAQRNRRVSIFSTLRLVKEKNAPTTNFIFLEINNKKIFYLHYSERNFKFEFDFYFFLTIVTEKSNFSLIYSFSFFIYFTI